MSILDTNLDEQLDEDVIHPWISANSVAYMRGELSYVLNKIEGHDYDIKMLFTYSQYTPYADGVTYTASLDELFTTHWDFGTVWSVADVDDIICAAIAYLGKKQIIGLKFHLVNIYTCKKEYDRRQKETFLFFRDQDRISLSPLPLD